MIIIWIIVAIFIFSLVILIHELGHFLAARKMWVKVIEFWLWIPPKVKKIFTDKLWTNYTLNWLPLGWFVRLNWEEDIKNRDYSDKTKFYNKSYLQKSIILLAWVFMNFFLASVIFSILFLIWIKPLWINDKISSNLNSKIIPTYSWAISEWILLKKEWLIIDPIKWSIAEKSWIENGDILLTINNKKINSFLELQGILNKNKWKKINLKIIKPLSWILSPSQEKEATNYKNIKIIIPENWKIWAYIWENIQLNRNFEYKYWIIDSIKYWFTETYIQSILTLKWLAILWKEIFSPEKPENRQEALNQMSWPIWIVDFVSNSIWAWIIFLSIITAIISINLGIFNLLPIPALDWWRWLFLTINTILQKIFWDKIKIENFENLVHLLFFIILIALSILIWYNDIIKIIHR